MFNGDKHLKALLQLMACLVNDRPVVYFTFGDDISTVYEQLMMNDVKIHELWSCLLKFAKRKGPKDHFFDFIVETLAIKTFK